MGRFSRKHGGGPRVPLRHDEVSTSLRHHLWTKLHEILGRAIQTEHTMIARGVYPRESAFLDEFWTDILNLAAHRRPQGQMDIDWVGDWWYHKATWVEVYDTIDFAVHRSPKNAIEVLNERLLNNPLSGCAAAFNEILEREMSPWRFVNNELVPIASSADIAAVTDALRDAPDLVREHLKRALENLGQRPTPNVHGAIAEAMHAVESATKHVLSTTKSTYPGLSQTLESRGAHPLFVRAFKDLYNATSDAGGTRHGFKPGEDPTKHVAEGRLFVVMSSAYVNYLLEAHGSAAPPPT